MLFFFSVQVDHTGVTFDELWERWEAETNAALGAQEAGLIKHIWKVSGQRRVVGVMDVESHEQLDQIVMAGLPMAHMLTFDDLVPIREYAGFADDVRRRWQA